MIETKTETKTEDMPEVKKISNKDAYILRIKYFAHYESHSGYCSDPQKVTTKDVYETELIPLPSWLEVDTDHISTNGTLLVPKDLNIRGQFDEKWSHGNGHCGCRCYKTFVSAKLIPRNKRI